MTVLTKGQNAPLPGSEVLVSVDVGAPADLSALLVTDAMTVRTDADFVFYNQPTGPGVDLQNPTNRPVLRVRTDAVPADIHAVRAVITLDDASSSFGRLGALVAHVTDARGTELFTYTIDGLSSESVVVALELYRRGAGWKVRAVGQGYAGGFADLVRDHGVSVDDAPAPTPAAPVTPPPPPPPAPTSGYAPPPPGFTPQGPAPQGFAPPPPVPPTPPAPTPAPAPPSAPGEVSLTKNRRVDLSKGQKVSLRKDGGVALTRIRMGLGWDPIKRGGFFGGRQRDIDLDASVLMFSRGQVADVVYYGSLRSDDNSIVHSGDNLTGQGEGDDEVINVDLTAIHPAIDNLVFTVTSYQGQTFQEVDNAYCRLVDETTGAELARFTLAGGMAFTGVTMAVISRENGEWKLRAIGDGFQGKTPRDAVPHAARHLA
ncbi:TerD family protein [Gordonia polyisoprenivorans]|uniref:TerD family protein n=1 Tax=Gordonia polyisoprenivorans TaxID=84595 RepID=UPI000B99E630|nr:TerD family protein [Gordonia polyisoprenivorans]OZC32947.1 stress protein [Gordonia polyisoprenivorans]